MNTFKLSNIPLNDFRDFLKSLSCEYTPGKGGHEKWFKKGMTRQIILQTHLCPVPEFIIQNSLRDLSKTKNDLKQFMLKKTKAAKTKGAGSAPAIAAMSPPPGDQP